MIATSRQSGSAIRVQSDASQTERPAEIAGSLRTPRAAFVLAFTVFVATTIQVLAQPVEILIDGTSEWSLVLAPPWMFSILILGCAAQAAAFLLSHRWPEATLLITVAVYLSLAVGLAVPSWLIGMYLVMALALFLLAARRSVAVSAAWLVAVVVGTAGVLLPWTLMIGFPLGAAFGFVTPEAVRIAAPAAAATALGAWWGTQSRGVEAARAQAEAVERDHAKRVEEAEHRERARIAQELHDVAGQHLAGLITLADAALTIAPSQPDQALHLVEEVRNEGRFAAASLAGALADLRAAGAEPREMTRDLRRTDELVEYWRRRGMRIQLDTTGPMEDLPAVVSATGYRCIQEAITNAAKHASGAEVRVDVAARADRLDVKIENGPSPAGNVPLGGLDLGWGLSGIRERIDLLRGTLVFGPTPEGGWMVRFVIPVAQSDRD